MKAKTPLAVMKEERAVERRHRLLLALKAIGITAKEASLRAGLSATYIHDFLHGKSPAADQPLQAICEGIGVLWEWLDGQIPESGPMRKAGFRALGADPETTLLLLESVIGFFAPQADAELAASILLRILVDVAQDPPIGGLKNDELQRERIRNIISGALRAVIRP